MIYLKNFNKHTDYSAYIGDNPTLPNVSTCTRERHVHFKDTILPPQAALYLNGEVVSKTYDSTTQTYVPSIVTIGFDIDPDTNHGYYGPTNEYGVSTDLFFSTYNGTQWVDWDECRINLFKGADNVSVTAENEYTKFTWKMVGDQLIIKPTADSDLSNFYVTISHVTENVQCTTYVTINELVN